MKVLLVFACLCTARVVSGQAKLVINGAVISLQNNVSLVIDNPDNTAISRSGSGYIRSEGAGNQVIWSVGAGNGNTYLVPFGSGTDYLPLSFHASGGAPTGKIIFSTYPTPTWKNSDDLPPGVLNVNRGAADNSAKLIDRFWQIKPQGYATRPSLTDLVITYSDNEYAPPNTIPEANLIAQRWNNALDVWDDYIPVSVLDPTLNTITITSMPGSELYDWWTLVDASSPLPITLINFSATVQNNVVLTKWQTALESNSSHFEVWRSPDLQHFDSVGYVTAAGNSPNVLDYSFIDYQPYAGVSYYRLKSVDLDGSFVWSSVQQVVMGGDAEVSVYPNPADAMVHLRTSEAIAGSSAMVRILNNNGGLVMTIPLTAADQQFNISTLAAGTYRVQFMYKSKPYNLTFIKK